MKSMQDVNLAQPITRKSAMVLGKGCKSQALDQPLSYRTLAQSRTRSDVKKSLKPLQEVDNQRAVCDYVYVSILAFSCDLIFCCTFFYRYRMLSRPYAFGCILRLRTSTEFKPGHSVSCNTVILCGL